MGGEAGQIEVGRASYSLLQVGVIGNHQLPLTLSREFILSVAEGKGERMNLPLLSWFDKLTTSGNVNAFLGNQIAREAA